MSVIGSDNGSQALSVVSPTITTTLLNDLLVGFVKVSAGATFTAGTGFTLQTAESFNFLAGETGPAPTPGNYDATFTINAAQTWQSAVVAVGNNPNQTTLSWTASTETGGTIASILDRTLPGRQLHQLLPGGHLDNHELQRYRPHGIHQLHYKIAAQDTTGTVGPYSSGVTVVTPSPTPSAPSNLSASADRQGPIVLTWTASTSALGSQITWWNAAGRHVHELCADRHRHRHHLH